MKQRLMSKNARDTLVYGILGIISFLLVWQLACLFTNFGRIFPTPGESFRALMLAFVEPIGKYTIVGHIATSLRRVLIGYVLSSVCGIFLGLLMGYSEMANAILFPIFSIIRPIPGIAWIPLAILWIGIGESTIYFIIFMGGFSQMVMNTIDGAQQVNRELVGVAKVLGIRRHQLFGRILLPSAVPYIFTGLQTSLSTSWMAVLAAEMITATEGVGWLILSGMQTGRVVNNVIGMLSIGGVGLILASLLREAERRLCIWSVRS
ncbi:MAG: ABC transporter permease [Sphaerochaeta sp.]|nr:ABC transporter permease [Sphaerochaeta sp.]